MRRALAITLLAIFGWMPMAAIFAPGAEASLPPCCRRHGRHHCAMQRLLARCGRPDGPPAFEERCPYAGRHGAAAQMRLPRPERAAHVVTTAVEEAAQAAEIAAWRESVFCESSPQRGPPKPASKNTSPSTGKGA